MKRIVICLHDIQTVDWPIVYQFIEECRGHRSTGNDVFEKMKTIAEIRVDNTNYKHDITSTDLLDIFSPLSIANEKELSFVFITKPTDESTTPLDYVPLFILHKKYFGIVAIGIDLINLLDARKQENLIFRFSTFFLFIEDIELLGGYHSLYFINEIAPYSLQNQKFFFRNKVSSFKYKGRFYEISSEDITKISSTKFNPLLHIDKHLFLCMFQNKTYNEDSPKEVVFLNSSSQKIIKRLKRVREFSTNDYSSLFEKWFVLAFFNSLPPATVNDKTVRSLYPILHSYYIGIYELVQNIVFHSEKQEGWIYIYFCTQESLSSNVLANLKEYKADLTQMYLRFGIFDFSKFGIIDTYNNKNNECITNLADIIDPYILPSGTNQENEYLILKYVAHLGIKTLVSLILSHHGLFRIETSNDGIKIFIENHGDSLSKQKITYNVEGTYYNVVLPIEPVEVNTFPYQVESQNSAFFNMLGEKKIIQSICIRDLENYYYLKNILDSKRQNEVLSDIVKEILDLFNENSTSNYLPKYYALDMSDAEMLTANMIFRTLAVMQLNNSYNHLVAVILYNLEDDTINSMCNIVKNIGDNKNEANQPIWSREHAVILINKSFRMQILCGETKNDISRLNARIERMYNGYTNMFSGWSNSENNTISSIGENFLLPYECMICKNGKPLFLDRVATFLDKKVNTNSDYGFLADGVFTKIGSKMYVEKFYNADTLFLNSFFADRLAFLIANDIISKLGNLLFMKNIVLIGYKSFSDLTIRKIQSYINAYARNDKKSKNKKDENVIQDVLIAEESEQDSGLLFRPIIDKECKRRFIDSIFILIVPVASTLSTHDKIVTYFMKESGMVDTPLFHNYCAILVRDGESPSVSSFEREWKWTTLGSDIIKTDLPGASLVTYLVSKSSGWHNLIDKKTFPPSFAEEIYLNRTGDASLNLWNMFGYPTVSLPLKKQLREEVEYISKCVGMNESEVLGKFYEITKRRIKELSPYIHVGHLLYGHNHHRYYFDTEGYIRHDNHKELNEWLKYIRENNLLWKDYSKVPVIIVPEYSKESTFINIVNQELFDNNALVIFINVSESIDNIRFSYSFLSQKSKSFSFFFVDHAILTAETFEKTRICLSAIMENSTFRFNGLLTMLNRLSEMKYKSISANLEGGKINSFVHFFIPPSKNFGEDCTLCGLGKHYKSLLDYSVVEACRKVIRHNKNKFELKKNLEEVNIVGSINRSYTRMDMRHNLFFMISCIQKNYSIDFLFKNIKAQESIKKTEADPIVYRMETALNLYYQNLPNDIDSKISFFKAITFPPLSQYVYIRRFAHGLAVKELHKVLSLKSPNYNDFCLLKTLLKHLSWLGSNAIIRKEVIISSWKLCFKVANDIEESLEKDRSESTDMFYQLLKEQLSKIEEFGTYYQFCIKNSNYIDEAKSFYLGELLRTGSEIETGLPLRSSRTILYNSLFRMIKNRDLHKNNDSNSKIKAKNPYRIFLSNVYYDNTNLFRKTLDNFSKEIKKDDSLSKLFNSLDINNLDDFNKKIGRISEKLLDLVNKQYYYYWFRLLLIEDTLNPGQYIDSTCDGIPLVKKFVCVLYAQRIISESISNEHSFENDVKVFLLICSAIMESLHSFITIKYEKKLYTLINYKTSIKFENLPIDLYCGKFLSMEEGNVMYPFIIKDNGIDTNERLEDVKPNRLCCQLLGRDENNRHSYLGAVTYLYSDDDKYFRIRKMECSRILLLLKPQLDVYVDHCYKEKLFQLWFKRMNTINQFKRINLSSNHRLHLDGWDFEKLDIENYRKIDAGFYMLSNVVISHLFSILTVEHEIKINSVKKSTDEIFSEKFLSLLEVLNLNRWGGKLIIINQTNDKKEKLFGNVLIIQSFVIQCIDNAYKKFSKKNNSKQFVIKLIIEASSIEIWNNFPGINIDEIKIESNKFNRLYTVDKIINNLSHDRMSDYGMTLSSLLIYGNSGNLKCECFFDLTEDPSFRVKLLTR